MKRSVGIALALLLSATSQGCNRKRAQNSEPAASAGQVDSPAAPASAKSEETTERKPAAIPQETAQKRRYVVAALGDSITDDQVGGGGYLRVLREMCPKSEFVNFGKGGDMTNQMRRRLEQELLPQKNSRGFTTLLIYGGVNDLYSNLTAGRTNDRIEEDLSLIYQSAHSAGLEVVAVTVSPWGGFTRYFNEERSQNTRLLNSWILGQVATGGVEKAVDSFPLLSCGNPDVLCPAYETRSHDGLHPGPDGHRLLGEKLGHEAFSDCL